ncbi:MAG: hypothetical protein ABSH28_05670 [Acidobacteriota bacterium]
MFSKQQGALLRSCSPSVPIIGIGIGVAIAVGLFSPAKPIATAIATAIPIPIPTFLAFCLYFWVDEIAAIPIINRSALQFRRYKPKAAANNTMTQMA